MKPANTNRRFDARPTVTRPTVTRPTVTRPTVTRPTVTRPTVTRPTTNRLTTNRPTTNRPTTNRSPYGRAVVSSRTLDSRRESGADHAELSHEDSCIEPIFRRVEPEFRRSEYHSIEQERQSITYLVAELSRERDENVKLKSRVVELQEELTKEKDENKQMYQRRCDDREEWMRLQASCNEMMRDRDGVERQKVEVEQMKNELLRQQEDLMFQMQRKKDVMAGKEQHSLAQLKLLQDRYDRLAAEKAVLDAKQTEWQHMMLMSNQTVADAIKERRSLHSKKKELKTHEMEAWKIVKMLKTIATSLSECIAESNKEDTFRTRESMRHLSKQLPKVLEKFSKLSLMPSDCSSETNPNTEDVATLSPSLSTLTVVSVLSSPSDEEYLQNMFEHDKPKKQGGSRACSV